ncbi:MAG: hypothetical protein B9S32_12055 [Verrucomicrobia bacterium Tous-C9LFEB]|nr:MAG: hypothetical protein B9S32_12055 [Verrucomicrobia bacterium Tous-C9LFEB]
MLIDFLGIQKNASFNGVEIDGLLEFCHWFMLILFVGWGCFFVYTLWRFHRSRQPKAEYFGVRNHVSTHLEFSVILIEGMLLLGFAIPLWSGRVYSPKDASVHVRGIAQQFGWNFHYPGPDGVFGRRDPKLISSNNPIGLDPNDPAGKDDLVASNEMHTPVGQTIVIDLTSKDVIHNYALPSMRVAQDAIPGTMVPVWFKPMTPGEYEIVCGQLCGSGHGLMRGMLVVDSAEDYKAWLDERAKLKAGAASIEKPKAAVAAVR